MIPLKLKMETSGSQMSQGSKANDGVTGFIHFLNNDNLHPDANVFTTDSANDQSLKE